VPDPERHLAAILSADAVGYSRLVAEDETATIRTLTAYRDQIRTLVEQHRGRVVDAPGDNVLAEFPTALDAVEGGVEIQRVIGARNADVPAERRMQFRVGIHLGDVAAEGGRIYGDGVNIAARLEALAEPGGICMSSEVHGQVQNRLDLGYEDLGEQSVKNIPKPVRVYRVCLDAGRREAAKPRYWTRLRSAAAAAAALIAVVAAGLWLSWPAPVGWVLDLAGLSNLPVNPPLPDKPSLVVLPFDNISGDPEQEYFADGITEDLTTDFSQNPMLFVIARNSAFTYKGKAVRIEDVGRELGVRYVVEGSVRRAGDQIRLTAQLIDATTGHHVWSERYDRELAAIFGLQDEVVRAILDSVGVEVLAHEVERARRRTTVLSTYDALMRGLANFALISRRGQGEARSWLERAVELDPNYAEPHAILAASYSGDRLMGWSFDPSLLPRAEEHARRCVAPAPSTPQCWSALANVDFTSGRVADAIRHAEKAVELAPGFFAGHFILGLALARDGQPLRAIESTRRAVRLDPHGGSVSGALAMANLRAGRESEAVKIFEQVRSAFADALPARVVLASHYEAAGNRAKARTLIDEIRAVNPEITAARIPEIVSLRALDPEQLSTIQENLRNAGLPDQAEVGST
jgi:TolB-like protein/class 3 adenylate cyclase/Tfp pilus assembly protein PilF